MATRSAIGFVEYDGSIRAIYCHWDGYPQHTGKVLEEYYDSIEKVENLLEYHPAQEFRNSFDFVQHYKDIGCEYFYLFDGNEWIIANRTGEFNPMGLVVSG